VSFRKNGKSPIIGVLDKKCAVCGLPGVHDHTVARPNQDAPQPPPPPAPSK